MEFALYEPGFGYYMREAFDLGLHGDFTTAPEISGIFSQIVANCCLEILPSLTAPVIMEVGAGLGSMAKGVLEFLARRQAIPRAYWIVEISPALQKQQYTRLKRELPCHLFDLIRWVSPPITEPFEGIVIGNEVLDALPVHRFVLRDDKVEEQGVVQTAQGLEFCFLHPTSPDFSQAVQHRLNPGLSYPSGYCSEIQLNLAGFLSELLSPMERGVTIWIDYGYSRREYYALHRHQGTLACYKAHQQNEDPLETPGFKDITAHVDFTDLAETGVACGLELMGYLTQKHFLVNYGAAWLAEYFKSEDPLVRVQGQKVKRLLHPALMGDQFKVMLLGRQMPSVPHGFQRGDISHTL